MQGSVAAVNPLASPIPLQVLLVKAVLKSMTWTNHWRADLSEGYTRFPGRTEKKN